MPMKYHAFLGGFHPEEQKQSLISLIYENGYKSATIKMPGMPSTKFSDFKNYCIVEFSNKSEYKRFLNTQNFYFKNRCLHAKPFFKGKSLKKEKTKNKNLKFFLKNIPLNWDHNDLLDFLSYELGELKEACVVTEPFSGNSKGIGYFILKDEILAANFKKVGQIFIDSKLGYLYAENYGAGQKRDHKNLRVTSNNLSKNRSNDSSTPKVNSSSHKIFVSFCLILETYKTYCRFYTWTRKYQVQPCCQERLNISSLPYKSSLSEPLYIKETI